MKKILTLILLLIPFILFAGGKSRFSRPSAGSITAEDEGSNLGVFTILDAVGAGVTATLSNNQLTLTIPGGGSATFTVQEDDVTVSTVINILDFLGADFDVAESPSGEANIVIASALARDSELHNAITVSGTPNYFTLSGQDLIRGLVDLATDVTGVLPGINGGTANGFFAVSGPASSLKTFTFPNVSSTVLTDNAVVTVVQGGIGIGTITGIMQGNGTLAVTGIANSSTVGQILRVIGASTYGWGALDLDDLDAFTGTLPTANVENLSGTNTGDVAEVNDLEATDPPNIEVNEVYVGTGSGAGAWGTVPAAALAADVIDESKIADNGIDSEHYNDGSVDRVHLASDVVLTDTAYVDLFHATWDTTVAGGPSFTSKSVFTTDLNWSFDAATAETLHTVIYIPAYVDSVISFELHGETNTTVNEFDMKILWQQVADDGPGLNTFSLSNSDTLLITSPGTSGDVIIALWDLPTGDPSTLVGGRKTYFVLIRDAADSADDATGDLNFEGLGIYYVRKEAYR